MSQAAATLDQASCVAAEGDVISQQGSDFPSSSAAQGDAVPLELR